MKTMSWFLPIRPFLLCQVHCMAVEYIPQFIIHVHIFLTLYHCKLDFRLSFQRYFLVMMIQYDLFVKIVLININRGSSDMVILSICEIDHGVDLLESPCCRPLVFNKYLLFGTACLTFTDGLHRQVVLYFRCCELGISTHIIRYIATAALVVGQNMFVRYIDPHSPHMHTCPILPQPVCSISSQLKWGLFCSPEIVLLLFFLQLMSRLVHLLVYKMCTHASSIISCRYKYGICHHSSAGILVDSQELCNTW